MSLDPCARCGNPGGPATSDCGRPIRCDSRKFGGPEGTCKNCNEAYRKAHKAGRALNPIRQGKDLSPGGAIAQEVARLAREGLAAREVAARLRVGIGTVYRLAQEQGAGWKAGRERFEDVGMREVRLRVLAARGLGYPALAEQFGVAASTIEDAAARLGIAVNGRVPALRAGAEDRAADGEAATLATLRHAAARYLEVRAAAISAGAEYPTWSAARRRAEEEATNLLSLAGMPLTLVHQGHSFALDATGDLVVWKVRPGEKQVKARRAERAAG